MSWKRLHEFCGLRPDAGGRRILQGFARGRGRHLHVPLHVRACGLRPWTKSRPEGACTCAMLGMAAEADVVKVTALARWLLQAAALCTVRAQCSRAVPGELETNNRVSREKHIFTNAREETKKQSRQRSITAKRMTNAAASLQQQAAISQEATASSHQSAPAMTASAMTAATAMMMMTLF